MKRSIILIVLLLPFIISCNQKTSEKIDRVTIVQEYYDQFYNEIISALIYDGNPDEIKELVKKIQRSRNISDLFVVKEALIEGEFSVKFYRNNINFLNYRIFNSQNAYDEINNKFKKLITLNLIPNKINNSSEYIPSGSEMLTREDFFRNCSEDTIKSIFNDIKEIDSEYIKVLKGNEYIKSKRILYGRKNNKNVFICLIKENDVWKCLRSVEYSDNVIIEIENLLRD